ncbi:MAG: cobalamin-dependent protein [Magnetococcales bacterium]|nr:cobalamin-dependent protein [Magnetococcales bacterium]
MKLLLINLPKNLDNRYDYDLVIQPLGLACIASFLQSKGFDTVLYDANAYHLVRSEILQYIDQIGPDMIGISVMTYQLPIVVSFLRDLKRRNSHLLVVLGGPHVSAEPQSTMECCMDVDYVVTGEGEYTMLELLTLLKQGGNLDAVKGIGYRHENNIIINPHREMIKDLNELPYADWSSLPMEKYWDVFTTRKNYARIFASRGCPYKCTFCDAPRIMGNKLRKRTPENIIGEITLLYDKYNVREFLFNDSTLNIDNKWLVSLCEEILKMGRPIIWRCNVRADRLQKDILHLMKRSGCVKVIMGIESADDAMLRSMQKGESLDDIRRGMQILKEVGMPSDHGFIIGMPGDTVESIHRSIHFAREIDASVVTFSLATPFPGTAFYEQAKQEGMVVNDWAKFDFFGIPYVPQGMTKEQLQECYRLAVKEFYLRPKYLWHRLLEMRSFTNLRINLWFAFRILQRRYRLGVLARKEVAKCFLR